MASELAERRGIALVDARALLAEVDLSAPAPAEPAPVAPEEPARRGTRRPHEEAPEALEPARRPRPASAR